MVSYKEYYYLCKKNYKKTDRVSKKKIYNFTVDFSPSISVPINLIDNLYQKTLVELESPRCIETDFSLGLGQNLYNLENEIESISSIIIPYLEKEIYGCYLNLTRAYIYKNIKTEKSENSSWKWHWDNHPDEMLKVIIYLTDTFKSDGPFQILKHKQKNIGYRMPTNRFGPGKWGDKNIGSYPGCRVSEKQIDDFKQKNYEPFKIVGEKGKIIIFNENIIHKANIPKNNERVILTLQVKPILIKRDKYFSRQYTGTFGNELGGAIGSKNPFQTDNISMKFDKIQSTNHVTNYQNKIIVKFFKEKVNYQNEIKVLSLLKNEKITPKIISSDESKLLIIYEFSGEKLNTEMVNNNIRQKFKNILNILEKFKITHNDLSKVIDKHFQNILILKDNIRVIDFEFATINNVGPNKPRVYKDTDILKY